MDLESLLKWLGSVILGVIIAYLNYYGLLSLMLVLAVMFDLVTGLIKAKIQETISSKIGYKGLLKKLSLFLAIGAGFLLDLFEHYLITLNLLGIDVSLPFNIPFAHMIGCYILVNEFISIIENLHACGVPIPKAIKSSLIKLGDTLEEKNNKEP